LLTGLTDLRFGFSELPGVKLLLYRNSEPQRWRFALTVIETLIFQKLMAMARVTVETLPPLMLKAGIYLFSENRNHLYVGRTNSIKKRLK
jgi:hypothetical protein